MCPLKHIPTGKNRRTVKKINKYLPPMEIYNLITRKHWPYKGNPIFYIMRDKAFMSLAFCSAGRIAPICGGEKMRVNEEGKIEVIGSYAGLQNQNFEVRNNFILVRDMEVGKRSKKTIERHGPQVAIRDEFALPLECGLYENRYWDQLVPFSHLVLEYLENFVLDGKLDYKLFNFGTTRGWQIIKHVTKMFPNWFRAQAEHFHGHFTIKDSVKLAAFVKVVRPEQLKHYIGFEWREQLKEGKEDLDFSWIQQAINATNN